MRKRFTVSVEVDRRGRTIVPLPFDPNEAWGSKERHHVRGELSGAALRGAIEAKGGRFALVLGPAWTRDRGIEDGARARVWLEPEGPQRGDLAEDVAAALAASPRAAAFFDSLAQFYRKAYLRWVDSTKRSPDERARRIAEMVALLESHHKERPRT